MESQGALVDGCPYCRVLHPGAAPCSRCDGAPRLVAAQMLDEVGVRGAVARAVASYDGTRQRLDELLQVLFVHRPASLRALAADGRLDLERLRRDDATLAR